MRFPPLLAGRLVRRYKRFLADVELASGETVTAHSPNTGAMTGCAEPGSAVRLSRSEAPHRKLAYTWELARSRRAWVMVNTHRANGIVEEAVLGGRIPELSGFSSLRREVRYGSRSRIDLLLEGGRGGGRALVEVKNVTLAEERVALFPDAVTERGRKHLHELVEARDRRTRSVLVFCVSRGDCRSVSPADAVDPLYGRTLRWARGEGLEVLAYGCRVGPSAVRLLRRLPVRL